MGPAEGEREYDDSGWSLLQERMVLSAMGPHRLGNVGEWSIGGSGGIDDVHEPIESQDDLIWELLSVAILPHLVNSDLMPSFIGLREETVS